MKHRRQLGGFKRWVVKIGSALLTNDGKGLDRQAIAGWSAQMAQLHRRGIELVLVSSGAIAAGMTRLGWPERPHAIHELQAAAAVGQMGLIQTYESCFQAFDLHTAQVLLGHDDLSARDRYLNARKTLATLLGLGVVPIVNENDTVVTDEIRFGDNDTLGALVANLVEADLLIILTDQRGLFEKDPRKHSDAPLVSIAEATDASLEDMAGSGAGALGRGGMITKVRAARLAARSGTNTIIAGGSVDNVLLKLAAGEEEGTLLTAKQEPIAARKQWLAGMLKVAGCLQLDEGAVRVLKHSGKSLLAVGVCGVSGDFKRGDLVSCVDGAGVEVARGLVNYSAQEAACLAGQASERIEELLGYRDEEELIHRDNLVLI